MKFLSAKAQFLPVITLFVIILYSCNEQKRTPALNDLQVIGSHNSYKIALEKPLWNFLYQLDSTTAKSLQYTHIPIVDQLNLGLRNLELDVYHDPMGSHYLNPRGLDLLKSKGVATLAFDKEEKLKQSGLKVFHVQDIDFRSHYLLFKDALKALKTWSDKHPNHTPIFITMNANDRKIKDLRDPLPFTANALDSISIEIKSVFPNKQLITPDLVRGNFKTLEQAILSKGWPKLKEMKGRFLFVLDEGEEKNNRYLKKHPLLKGGAIFVNSKEGNPEAAFRIVNNPIKDFEYIQQLVKKGYIVRTRADDGTKQARTNNYSQFEKAKASGAQIITTDYYMPSTLFKSTYKISFDNHTFERINNKQ